MTRCIMILEHNVEWNKVFADLYNDERVDILDSQYYGYGCKAIRFIRKVHLSRKINGIIKLPLKRIWYTLSRYKFNKDDNYYIIFPDVIPYDSNFMRKLKSKYNIKYVLLSMNKWEFYGAKRIRDKFESDLFDYVFTFDPDDSKRYGFLLFDSYYSVIKPKCTKCEKKDILFVGIGREDRIFTILKVFEEAERNHLSTDFYVLKDKRCNNEIYAKYSDRINILDKSIPYEDVVEKINSSNCILEVLSPGQSGATLRYYEAVVYNKKLLTNNKNVVNLPFYNQEYIHVFEKIDDIDWKWIREKESIDYHYDGRFSPTKMIDKIISLNNET